MTQSKSSRPSPPVPAEVKWDDLVGRNLAARRNALGLRQDEVARKARDWGLKWTRSTVAAVENGLRSLDLREAVALVPALGLELADLFAGEEWVKYSPAGRVRASAVAAYLSGRCGDVDEDRDFHTPAVLEANMAAQERMARNAPEYYDRYREYWREASDEDMVRAEAAAGGEAESRAAKTEGLLQLIGGDPMWVSVLAHRLWGCSLTDRRDHLVAEAANEGASRGRLQALRGHVTRRLIAELAEAAAFEEEISTVKPAWLPVRTRAGAVLIETDEKAQPTGRVAGSEEALHALDEDFGEQGNDTKESD